MSMVYNNMLAQDAASFETFVKTYSIAPPDDPGFTSHVAVKAGVNPAYPFAPRLDRQKIAARGSADPRLTNSSTTDIQMRKVPKSKGAVYFDLNPYPVGGVSSASHNKGGNTMYIAMSENPQAGFLPTWFLPWNDGSVVRLTIPPVVAGQPNPNIFFTAAIGGCSIFIQGRPDSPTIFHAGGGTGFGSMQLDEGAQFWEAIMDEFVTQDDARGKSKGPMHTQSVDKRDYVTEPGQTWMDGSVVVKTTARAKAFQKELKGKYRFGRVGIEEVSPWGCVLGRREASGAWKFYLQENAIITYHQLSLNPIKNLRGKAQKATVSRPMTYREIFPGGGMPQATFSTPLPRLI